MIVAVLAVVGLDAAFAAEDFPALQALVALHAAVDHAADGDRVADLVAGDLAADGGDGADDLVAGDVRIDVPPQSLRAVWRSEWQMPA